jgi:peptide/nickel transport system permease protein
LGFGDLYHPTWGTMINFAYKRGAFIRQAYHYLLTPGICIMLLSLSFYLISLYIDGRKNTIQEA